MTRFSNDEAGCVQSTLTKPIPVNSDNLSKLVEIFGGQKRQKAMSLSNLISIVIPSA